MTPADGSGLLKIVPTGTVGAEVQGVDLASLRAAQIEAIKQAWYQHDVLVFRRQKLTDDDLLAFSRHFGELDPPPNQGAGRKSPPGYPDIYVVSNVLDGRGGILAGARQSDGRFADTAALLTSPDGAELLRVARPPEPTTNTTLAAVITDAPLSRVDLARVARMAATALARRISPVNSPFDGDVVVALSTAATVEEVQPVELLALGVAAAAALETAIERAVRADV